MVSAFRLPPVLKRIACYGVMLFFCGCMPNAEPPSAPSAPRSQAVLPPEQDRLSAIPPSLSEGFEEAFLPHTQSGKGSRLDGELAANWKIRPLVNDYQGSLQRLDTNVSEGRTAQRIHLEQIYHTYFDLSPTLTVPENKVIRIQIDARSPSTARMDVGLRKADSSDRLSWEQRRVYVPAEWMRLEFLIPPRSEQASEHEELVFRMVEPGTIDLDHLRVWILDLEDLNAGIPDTAGNLLPQSTFPNGLPFGWSRSHAGWRVASKTMPGVTDPEGTPAVEIPRGGSFLCTPPFQALGGTPTRVQGWIRSKRPGQRLRLELTAPPESSVQRMTLNGDWQKLDVTFDTPYPLDGFQILKFHTPDTYWLTGLHVSQRENPEEAERAELHLFHQDPYGLQADGSDLSFQVWVRSPVPSYLTGKFEDVYGTQIPFGPLPLTSDTLQTVTPNAEGMSTLSPLGSYRIEARMVDASGEALTPWGEMMVHRIREPRSQGRFAADSPFGIHAAPVPSQAAMVKRLGFNWIRMHDAAGGVKWNTVEREKGTWTFSSGETQISVYRDHHLSVLGVLDTSPPWASDVSRQKPEGPWNGYWDKHWAPKEEEAWAEYCRKVTRHFRDQVDAWEIWNEPYVGRFFRMNWNAHTRKEEKGTPEDYARLAAMARNGVDEVVVPNLLLANKQSPWGEAATRNGIPEGIEKMTFHLYTPQQQGFPGDAMSRAVSNLREQMKTAGTPDMELWNTEGGPGPALHTFFRHTGPTQPTRLALDQANGLVRQYLSQLAHGVDRFFLYSMHGTGGWSTNWVVMMPTDELPPHATALSNLFWQLEGTKMNGIQQEKTGKWITFSGSGRTVSVWMPVPGNTVHPKLPATINAWDLFGNPYDPSRASPSWPMYIEGSVPPA